MGTAVPAIRPGHRIASTADTRREIVKTRRLDAILDRRHRPADTASRLAGRSHRLGHDRAGGTKRINRIPELIDRHRAGRRAPPPNACEMSSRTTAAFGTPRRGDSWSTHSRCSRESVTPSRDRPADHRGPS